jgi:hypothetical protein
MGLGSADKGNVLQRMALAKHAENNYVDSKLALAALSFCCHANDGEVGGYRTHWRKMKRCRVQAFC